jgi:hypothetical protein
MTFIATDSSELFLRSFLFFVEDDVDVEECRSFDSEERKGNLCFLGKRRCLARSAAA